MKRPAGRTEERRLLLEQALCPSGAAADQSGPLVKRCGGILFRDRPIGIGIPICAKE